MKKEVSRQRKYAIKNREKYNEYQRFYKKNNRDKVNTWKKRRRNKISA